MGKDEAMAIEQITLATGDESVTITAAELAAQENRDRLIRIGSGSLHPEDNYPVPSEAAFEIPDPNRGKDDEPQYHDYLPGDDIARIAASLIGRHPQDFKHLPNAPILYRWKREGGKNAGKLRLGQCRHLDAVARHFAGSEFLIWLAADHLRAHRFTARQVEAAIFHELLHIELAGDDKPRLAIAPHDFEGFGRELAVYGPWRGDLRIIQRQMALFDRSAVQ